MDEKGNILVIGYCSNCQKSRYPSSTATGQMVLYYDQRGVPYWSQLYYLQNNVSSSYYVLPYSGDFESPLTATSFLWTIAIVNDPYTTNYLIVLSQIQVATGYLEQTLMIYESGILRTNSNLEHWFMDIFCYNSKVYVMLPANYDAGRVRIYALDPVTLTGSMTTQVWSTGGN